MCNAYINNIMWCSITCWLLGGVKIQDQSTARMPFALPGTYWYIYAYEENMHITYTCMYCLYIWRDATAQDKSRRNGKENNLNTLVRELSHVPVVLLYTRLRYYYYCWPRQHFLKIMSDHVHFRKMERSTTTSAVRPTKKDCDQKSPLRHSGSSHVAPRTSNTNNMVYSCRIKQLPRKKPRPPKSSNHVKWK